MAINVGNYEILLEDNVFLMNLSMEKLCTNIEESHQVTSVKNRTNFQISFYILA